MATTVPINIPGYDIELNDLARRGVSTLPYDRNARQLIRNLLKQSEVFVDHNYVTNDSPANTSENDLFTYAITAGILVLEGTRFAFEFSGICINSVDNKVVRLKFGATTVLTLTLTTQIYWKIRGAIFPVSQTAQRVSASAQFNGGSPVVFVGNLTEAVSGALDLKITGQAAGGLAADISQRLASASFSFKPNVTSV